MSTRCSGVSGKKGRALWRKRRHCSFHHSLSVYFPPDFASMQLRCFCYSVKRVILRRGLEFRETATRAPINESWNEWGPAQGILECPPALWLNESCVRGKQSQKRAEPQSSPPHTLGIPLLPPASIRAFFKHMAEADVPERTFCSPPHPRIQAQTPGL